MEPQSSELSAHYEDALPSINVLIDGRKIGDGGIGVYIDNLVRGFLETRGVVVTVLSSAIRQQNSTYRNDVRWLTDEARSYSINEMFLLSRRIKFEQFHLFHSPHYTLPFGIPVPKVITVHDLIQISHPEKFYYPYIARKLIKSGARRADAIITVSRDTRRALLALGKLDPEKVTHIPNAINSLVTISKLVKNPPTTKAALLAPYFLAVFSNIKPHKGLRDLISAFRALRASGGSLEGTPVKSAKLVLVGFGTEEILHSNELLRLIGDENGVHILGPVSNDELSSLYSKALAVVIPSLTEGFCFPALEAQANGVPVICRPVPALLELITENDLVAKDFSISSLTSVMIDACKRGGARFVSSLSRNQKLEEYSRDRVIEQTQQLYRAVLSRRST